MEQIRSVDLSPLAIYSGLDPKEFFLENRPGKEHYKLLAYLSTLINGQEIFDIGTHRGSSALALSYNERNKVFSFDLENKIPHGKTSIRSRQNIELHMDNLLTPEGRAPWESRLLASPLIFLDIDPHDGFLEYEFFEYLLQKEYKGILICDDIWYFKGMRDNFWLKIPSEYKTDITHLGHWSGTGLVCFSSQCSFPMSWLESEKPNIFNPKDTSNWTLVTAYFDLTKMEDASQPIKDRPATHYLANANFTLSLDHNLVIFCEPENRETILSMRPPHLREKTLIITQSFESFPMTQYREKIKQNRRDHPYHFDERNTASYYLFCMARYAMLKQIIAGNPFGSTHFAWINICMERMGFKNLIALEGALALNREKFSTCYIDYVPPHIVYNTPEYFRFGRCSLCSGFFTGNAHYMKTFCDLIEEKFLYYLEQGYGHADEQLYCPISFEHPEIFDWYVGDYLEMITNYRAPVENVHNPINHIISSSFAYGNPEICSKACQKVMEAFCKFGTPLPDFYYFYDIYEKCKLQLK